MRSRKLLSITKRIGKVSYVSKNKLKSLDLYSSDSTWLELDLSKKIKILNKVAIEIHNNRDGFFIF